MVELGEKNSSEEIDNMMNDADSDKDGRISWEEFKKIVI